MLSSVAEGQLTWLIAPPFYNYMNKPVTLKHALDSANKLGERFLSDPSEIAAKPETPPPAETPHRASAVTPRISDVLARVEGIQRWGLNE